MGFKFLIPQLVTSGNLFDLSETVSSSEKAHEETHLLCCK